MKELLPTEWMKLDNDERTFVQKMAVDLHMKSKSAQNEFIKSSIRVFFLAILFLLALTSCNNPPLQNSNYQFPHFEQTIGVNELPRNLIIEPLISDLLIDESSSIDFLITNDSGYSIHFSPSYGVRIFAYEGSKETWIEVPNLVNYVGDGDYLGSKSVSSDNWIAYLTIAPDLPTKGTYEVLRVAVVGTISNASDSESVQVGSFIDIHFDTR